MKVKQKNKGFLIFSCIFYFVFVLLMLVGTFYDIEIDKMLFQPDNTFARMIESYGQVVYWGIWGPAFTVILLRRHNFNEWYDFCKKHSRSKASAEIKSEKVKKTLNVIITSVYNVALFVLSVIGWKKIIENIIKNILSDIGKANWSQPVYFVVSTVAALAALLIFSRISSNTLKKLEAAAVIGVIFGFFLKLVEEMKPITQRVRFREMVAYSNGYLNDNGMSEGKYSPLTSEMVNNTDFSAFTPWYKKGDAMGIYSRSDSFPSGHTSYSVAVFLSYFFFGSFEKLKKAAPVCLVFSFVYVAIVGCMRLVVGAHYLTDIAAAAIIGYTIFVVLKAVFDKLIEKKIISV